VGLDQHANVSMKAAKGFVRFAAIGLCLTISIAGTVGGVHAADRTARSRDVVGGKNYQPLPRKVVHEITSVSRPTLKSVGAGKPHGRRNHAPGWAKAGKLTSHGKPELVYIIGEFCPYCAGESWSVAVALSRFGKFHGLTTLTSSAKHDPASIQTMSFRYSRFYSRYLSYDPIVNEGVNFKVIEKVPPKIMRVWNRYGPIYPFMDFGGKAILDLPSFDPTLLCKLTRKEIAADLNHPTNVIAQAIDGSANQLTAAICIMTKEKPNKVCRTKTISTIRHSLRKARPPSSGAEELSAER
jgi:thiol-disulfide isomerase/thioredoxin